MSLRKSPSRTAAFLAAQRRNARKSTGPRTARGKTQSGLNGLKHGVYSPRWKNLLASCFLAPPGAEYRVALAALTPEQVAHPVFARQLDVVHWAVFGVFRDEVESKDEEERRPPFS